MWIRSQDFKKLVKATEIWIKNGHIYVSTSPTTIGWNGYFMGKYDEERCIDILSEIQSRYFLVDMNVYQMPEK